MLKDMFGQTVEIGSIIAWSRGGNTTNVSQCIGVVEKCSDVSCTAKLIKASTNISRKNYVIGRPESIIVLNEHTMKFILAYKIGV
jgi:hypothetical protein